MADTARLCGIECLEQIFEVPGAAVELSIDEKGGCAVDACALPAFDVPRNAVEVPLDINGCGHLVGIELQPGRELHEKLGRQAALVVEDAVVHLPVLAVFARELRCFRGGLGQRMNLREREIAKYIAYSAAEMLLQTLHDSMGHRAVRALEVTVFDQGDGSVRVALNVVNAGYGNSEVGHVRRLDAAFCPGVRAGKQKARSQLKRALCGLRH